jgi:hypothetical protein
VFPGLKIFLFAFSFMEEPVHARTKFFAEDTPASIHIALQLTQVAEPAMKLNVFVYRPGRSPVVFFYEKCRVAHVAA